MASSDWTDLTGVLNISSIDRGVTAGFTPPNGGGSFVFGTNSLVTTAGGYGMFCNLTDYAPMAKGGSIRGAIKRAASGGKTNFSPMFFIGAQGSAISDAAYLLGLQDDDPHRIVLRKGLISGGIPAGASGSGILKRSTATYAADTWLHLRLDMIVNLNGDVLLKAYQSDLANPVTAPVWVPIPGLNTVVDDALGITTGSAPYTSGRAGLAVVSADVSRRAMFDHVEVFRQL